MMVFVGCLLLIGLAEVVVESAPAKPAKAYFDICKTSDPNYSECVKKTLIKLTPQLIKGIPELNIKSIEPLYIKKIEMSEGSGNFKLDMKLSDLNIEGVSDYTIKHFSLDYNKKEMNYTMFFPRMSFKSDYELDGQILVLPVKGSGQSTLNFTDVTVSVVSKMELFKKKGKDYVRFKTYSLKIDPEGVNVFFSNLFNGDKALGDSTNKFFNDNWREAYYTYRILPEKAFGQYLKAYANIVLGQYPAAELFPK